MCLEVSAFAIDPNRTVSQYLHDSWATEKGFPGGSISGIAQTADGYLWIGTDRGLVRFDGLDFRKFGHATPSPFPIEAVQSLLADGQGNLWILLRSTKLLRQHDGIFELSRGEAENGITAIGRGALGGVLFSSLALGTLTYTGNRFQTVSPAALFADSADPAHRESPDQRSSRLSWTAGVMPDRLAAPTSAVISIATTAEGKIWLGTEDRGLFYLQGERVFAAANGLSSMKISCLLPLENSELWIGTGKGIWSWNGTELTRSGVPGALQQVEVLAMIRDRDSNIWVGTPRGLLRFNSYGVSSFARESRGVGEAVTALFEDREGNIWIGSARGLERLRDSAFVTYSAVGLESQSVGALYVDPEGKTWFAPSQGGLRWWKGGKSGVVAAAGLSQDIVYSISGRGKNELWVGRQRGGLTHLSDLNGSITARTYTQADGLPQNGVYAAHQNRDGSVWSATLSGGVSEYKGGHFTTYTTANGLASNTVSSIAEGADGTMWFGTPNGLSGLTKHGWRTYSVQDGLSSQDVNCLLLDSTGILWIGTAEGLAFLNADHIHVPHRVPDSLREAVFGIAEDRDGILWVATANHILQVKRNSLIEDALTETDVREYGLDEGLSGTEGVKRYQSVVADSQGRIWFSTNRGLSVVNPARAAATSAPALVHIEGVAGDGTALDLGGPVHFPSGTRRTTFRYVGLSLSNPERVRYRYRLDGFDHGWSELTANREATYNNLGVGTYRFRVMASNSDGLWNGSEAAVGFEVEPDLWQTWWFRFTCALALALTAWLLYRIRMHQKIAQLNVRFEERLAERTRIAQDLHDTLLQGVLSAAMHLHVVGNRLSDDSPAKPLLIQVQRLMDQVINEGRISLQGLRSSSGDTRKLEQAFSRIPQELGDEREVAYRVIVEGSPRPLHPVIRDEVYRIGREALVNAFRHATASSIEIQVEYTAAHLRVAVRDDGVGIDPHVLQSGREGHWGLPGMRERAERIGAKLKVWSGLDAGTEVELLVPRDVAYQQRSGNRRMSWIISKLRRPKRTEEA